MSGLWTPGGDRAGTPQPRTPEPEPVEPDEADFEAAMEEEMAAIRNTPAAAVVGNHAIQLFQLARIYLTAEPPGFEDAKVAIDAMAGIVESLGSRLGPDQGTLVDGLAQIRLAFVQMKAAASAKAAGVPQPEGTEGF